MAFTEYVKRGRRAEVVFKDTVRMSKEYLYLSKEFWQKELNETEFIKALYNQETNQVGLLPVASDHPNRLRVQEVRDNVMRIYIRGFNKAFKLAFNKPCNYTIVNAGDPKNKMRIFNLNN